MAVWASGKECRALGEIKEAIDKENHKQLAEWRELIDREMNGDLAQLDPVICRILDGIFRNNFITVPKKGKIAVSSHFMGSNEEAKEEWANYVAEVIPALQMAQSKSQLPRGFTARAALDLCWMPESKQPMPFLTESVVEAFFAVLEPVKDSITEVSIKFKT
jgi:hypothetical protein